MTAPPIDLRASLSASGAHAGLSAAEAQRRLDADGPNELPEPRRDPLAVRVLRQLREPMALLLIAAAAVDGLVLGERTDAIAILTIVVLNVSIAIVQEGRATRALDELRTLESPTARVRRDGRIEDLDARALVAGDLVLLSAGDRIPADVHFARTDGLEVDESVLTGESIPVTKDAEATPVEGLGLGDRPWMGYSGTLVTRGAAEAVVEATGARSELGTIASALEGRPEPTPLQRQLAHLTLVLGVAAVVLATGVAAIMVVREGAEEAFLTGVALAVAAVPEGLATVTVVALALGVRRMAQHGAIVRRLPAVETLGSTTVLAVDKTGTLTENRMRVDHILDARGQLADLSDLADDVTDACLRPALLCNDAQLEPASGDPIEIALLEAAGPETIDRHRGSYPRVASVPFDAERRWMATLHESPDGRYLVAVKGAPEAVLSRCETAMAQAQTSLLGPDDRARLERAIHDLAAGGNRLLAVAERTLPSRPDDLEGAVTGLTLTGVVALRDPVRSEATTAVRAVAGAGMRLMMVTGDHPGTAASVAEAVGLAGSGAAALTGGDLRAEGPPDDPAACAIYARVEPDQKVLLVDALHRNGEVVAMTGDGVNDAPALRAADIGVALGQTGSDVAREASDMVITDDNLATIVEAVEEGRGIYDNIRKVVEYLVAGNISEILVVIVALALAPDIGIPLLPLQILWVNLLTDGLPALALGVDPADPDLMRRRPRPRERGILDRPAFARLTLRATAIALAPLAALWAGRTVLDLEADEARSLMFTTLVVTHLLYAIAVRVPLASPLRGAIANRWLTMSVVGSLVLQIAVVSWSPAQDLFTTSFPSPAGWLVSAVAAFLAMSLVMVLRRHEPPARGAAGHDHEPDDAPRESAAAREANRS